MVVFVNPLFLSLYLKLFYLNQQPYPDQHLDMRDQGIPINELKEMCEVRRNKNKTVIHIYT